MSDLDPGTASLFVALVVAVGSTATQLPQRSPGPRTVPTDVRAACDAAYAVAMRTPGVSIERRTGTFRDETIAEAVFGCGLAISGSFARAKTSGSAADRLRQHFQTRGWQELAAYASDGTDGTSFAFRKAGVACLVRGTWDGGAADDPKLPALDWYKVAAFCTSPAFPENRPRLEPGA